MKRGRRAAGQGRETTETALVSLAEVERRLLRAGHTRSPSSAVMMRETAKYLRAMSGEQQPPVTLVCVRGDAGCRIAEGADSLIAARMMRARAMRHGEAIWAELLGRRLMFRIEYREPEPAPRRGSSVVKRGVRSFAIRSAFAAT